MDPNNSEVLSFDDNGNISKFEPFRRLFIPLTIILVALLSFGIGRLSVVGKREPVKIEYDRELVSENIPTPTTNTNQTASVIQAVPSKPKVQTNTDTQVVASKNGTKYHYSHCSGAKQIKEENKIVFATPEAAQLAGYTLAANCKP